MKMSTKLWCAVCQTIHSQLWMASDLVLPSTQLTVLERLKGLELQLQTHCILCTACYSLVEHWDKQIAGAAKTEQVLKGLIPTAQDRLHGGQESGDGPVIREQQKNSDGSPTAFSDSFSLEAVEPAKVSTDGLTDAEVAVADCLVTAFGRSQSGASDKNSADSDAIEVNLADSAETEANFADPDGSAVNGADPALVSDPDGSAVNEADPALVSVSGTDTGALSVGLSAPVLEGPVTHPEVVSVNVTAPVLEQRALDPVTPEVSVADEEVSGQCRTNAVMPDGGMLSESALPTAGNTHLQLPPPPHSVPSSPPPASGASEPPATRHHCHICGKGFARNGSLNDHLAAHAGTKAYACSECGLRFQYRDGLLVHRRRHHGGGRLACPHCSVHFEKSCNLRRHLRVHTGERPFGCSFCPKRFAQSNGLKKHVRSLHADRVTSKPS